MRAGDRLGLLAALLAATATSALMAYSSPLGVDYFGPPCDPGICDDGALPIDALIRGDLHGFFAEQQPMGPFSILLRAPLAALGHGELARYRLGAFVCLLAAGLLAVFLARTMAARGRSWMAWVVIPAAVLVNPLTYQALRLGHPEEILGAALAVGGVLAAGRRRVLLSGLLVGCAVATKQWAALAVIPAIVAGPSGARVRLGVTAVVVAGILLVPMAAVAPARFAAAQGSVGVTATLRYKVTAANVWWPFASADTAVVNTPQGRVRTTQYSLGPAVAAASRLLVIGLSLALSLLYARRAGGRDPDDVLALLALVLLARGMLDPLAYSYHHLPFLVALVAWEGLRRGVPVASAAAIAATLVLQFLVAPLHSALAVNVFYLAWTIPLATYLALEVLAPGRAGALRTRLAGAAGRAPSSAHAS